MPLPSWLKSASRVFRAVGNVWRTTPLETKISALGKVGATAGAGATANYWVNKRHREATTAQINDFTTYATKTEQAKEAREAARSASEGLRIESVERKLDKIIEQTALKVDLGPETKEQTEAVRASLRDWASAQHPEMHGTLKSTEDAFTVGKGGSVIPSPVDYFEETIDWLSVGLGALALVTVIYLIYLLSVITVAAQIKDSEELTKMRAKSLKTLKELLAVSGSAAFIVIFGNSLVQLLGATMTSSSIVLIVLMVVGLCGSIYIYIKNM